MKRDLYKMDAVAILAAYRNGSLTPSDYVEHIIDAADRFNDLNALRSFDPDSLRRSVSLAALDGFDAALAAIPLVIKDNINTTNYPTSAGTRALLNHTPTEEAGVVRAITRAGAVVGAKAGMHELAFGITSNNGVTGPIRNPHDPSRIPGGSSGGTAAAIAAGIFAAGLGTDTGGSARIPAALCGTVGFRPSTGRYESTGVVPIAHTRDTVGTFARSVRDVCLLDQVLANETGFVDVELSSLTFGIPKERFFDDLDPVVATVVQSQVETLARAGARFVEIDISAIWTHNDAFSFPVVLYEVMRDLPAYLTQHAPQVSFEALLSNLGSPDVVAALTSQLGPDAIHQDVYDAALNIHRPAMRNIYAQVFENYGLDAIVFPTTPLTARLVGEDQTVTINGKVFPTFPTYIRNTDLASNLGAPGISLPCPVEDCALPVGMELDCLPGEDLKLLAIARTVERTIGNCIRDAP